MAFLPMGYLPGDTRPNSADWVAYSHTFVCGIMPELFHHRFCKLGITYIYDLCWKFFSFHSFGAAYAV